MVWTLSATKTGELARAGYLLFYLCILCIATRKNRLYPVVSGCLLYAQAPLLEMVDREAGADHSLPLNNV